jgi:hypothetical protein
MNKNSVTYTQRFLGLSVVSVAALAAIAQPEKTTKRPAAKAAAKPARAKPAVQPKIVKMTPEAISSGIPIRFPLDKPAYVTLVIEDATGKRIRNLIAETKLPAGENLITWDGYDDGTRNENGDIVRRRVAVGTYRVRGLTHDGIKLVYEFTAYGGGNPAWKTLDRSGAWMADHSSPLGAVFLPAGLSPYGKASRKSCCRH